MVMKSEQIRGAIVTLLSGNTLAGTNIADSKITPVVGTDLGNAFINVFTTDESVNDNGSGHSSFQDQIELTIELMALVKISGTENPGERADFISQQIIDKMNEDRTLGGLANTCSYQGRDFEYFSEGTNQLAVVTLRFLAMYLGV